MRNVALTTAAATVTDIPWAGGEGIIAIDGTWGAGTVTLTYSRTAGGTYDPIGTGWTMTANGTKGFKALPGFLKLVLSGSTAATLAGAIGGIGGRAAAD